MILESKERLKLGHLKLLIIVKGQLLSILLQNLTVKQQISHKMILTILTLILSPSPTYTLQVISLQFIHRIVGITRTIENYTVVSKDKISVLQQSRHITKTLQPKHHPLSLTHERFKRNLNNYRRCIAFIVRESN